MFYEWQLSKLLLLSHFSHVRLCATPQMAAHQALPSLGFSRSEHPISFSNAWKWKVKVKSLSRVWLLATPWTADYQAPPSMGFSRQEYWSGVPLPSPMGRWQKFNLICLVPMSKSVISIASIELCVLNWFPDFRVFPDPESTDEEKARSPLRRSLLPF